MTHLLEELRGARSSGRKLVAAYTMGAIPDRVSYPATLEALELHADIVEVGLPFSDPLMDGPVIAAAGERVIQAGLGPRAVMELTGQIEPRRSRVVMTYYNPIHRVGEDAFCASAAAAGFRGLIVPDLPLEESESLRQCAESHGLAWVALVAPTSSPERIEAIATSCTGFIYAISTLGVTGTRDALSQAARQVVDRCREATDLPVLVGIGVSTAEQAAEAVAYADGVVIGSAIVKLLLEQGPPAAAEFLASVRSALDEA